MVPTTAHRSLGAPYPCTRADSGGATTETVVMDIRVGIPFVGGKIEGLVADMLRAALEIENEVGRDYLSR